MNVELKSYSFGMPWESAYGFSQAIQTGTTLYISGQLSHDMEARLSERATLTSRFERPSGIWTGSSDTTTRTRARLCRPSSTSRISGGTSTRSIVFTPNTSASTARPARFSGSSTSHCPTNSSRSRRLRTCRHQHRKDPLRQSRGVSHGKGRGGRLEGRTTRANGYSGDGLSSSMSLFTIVVKRKAASAISATPAAWCVARCRSRD